MAIKFEDREVRGFTADEAMRLVDLDLIANPEGVELLHGLLVEKPVKHVPHERVKSRLNVWLARGLAPECHEVRVESPFAVPDGRSLPEPDLMVIAAGWDLRRPSEALLIIEVSDTSLRTDLHVKTPMYASAGVPEYWVVDVEAQQIVVHTEPGPDCYRWIRFVDAGELVPSRVTVEPLDVAALFA